MKCPVCSTVDLALSERQGIEIDYCPQCRGVWLDRGELDKIIERARPEAATAAPTYSPSQEFRGEQDYGGQEERRGEWDDHSDYRERDRDRDRREAGKEYGKRKRRSFLDNIFDFD